MNKSFFPAFFAAVTLLAAVPALSAQDKTAFGVRAGTHDRTPVPEPAPAIPITTAVPTTEASAALQAALSQYFQDLRKRHTSAVAAMLVQQTAQDKTKLEALRKRAVDAVDTVTAKQLSDIMKCLTEGPEPKPIVIYRNEKGIRPYLLADANRILALRARVIQQANINAAKRFKPDYEVLRQKAIAAEHFTLAEEINGVLDTLPAEEASARAVPTTRPQATSTQRQPETTTEVSASSASQPDAEGTVPLDSFVGRWETPNGREQFAIDKIGEGLQLRWTRMPGWRTHRIPPVPLRRSGSAEVSGPATWKLSTDGKMLVELNGKVWKKVSNFSR